MTGRKLLPLIVGIHAGRRGFGWASFASPLSIHDFGVVGVRRNRNETCIEKIERLLDRLNPEMVVLETFEATQPPRTDRVVRLGRAIVSIAMARGIDVAIYSKIDVQACFAPVGARTRQEIAEAIARSIPILRDSLPARRKQWNPEDERMALFNAAAVVLTHYRLGSSQLFDDLLHMR